MERLLYYFRERGLFEISFFLKQKVETRVWRVAASTDKLHEVQGFVDAELEAHNCPMKTQLLIDVSLEELFVNIAHYAYPEGGGWAEDRQIGGLGIYMVKKKMDEMTYERRDDKNVLTIRKRRR